MTKFNVKKKAARALSQLTMLLVAFAFFAAAASAQTGGGTVISNQASATYGDGNGNSFSTVSNTVTVTVANVSGITITPDAGTRASVVAGQTGVLYNFRVTNTGNFADQIRFLASGASIQLTGTGTATITRAVIDNGTTSGAIDASDTNILTNSADVLSASLAQNGYIDVLVEVSVSASSPAGSTIKVQLGDASGGAPSYDNQLYDSSAHEVRTVSTASVNGLREGRADVSATVDNDAQLQLGVTHPAGPVSLGSDITYGWTLCNTGARAAQSMTLGGTTGVFIVAPIPVGTTLKSGQTFPAGTLYSNSSLATAPTAATWSSTASGTVTRVAFNVGSTLAAPVSPATSNCATAVNMIVTITTSNATNDIYEIGDAFANNSLAVQITDQSGDTVSNKGDGNANFDEPVTGGTVSTTQGFQVKTTLTRTGSVLIGPSGQPSATGPTSNNDDYTNRSVTTGIAGVAFGSNTTASGQVVFTNTISNTGNANDTYALSVFSQPSGFTVEFSTDGGANYTVMTTNTVPLAVAFGSTANVLVRVTSPSGKAVMSAYPVVVRATSGNTSSATNDTIDRLYTGALRMTKTASVSNTTGVGAATDPVPGAVITYTITYVNITSPDGVTGSAVSSGTNSSGLTLSGLVITEDGVAGSNNWGSTTAHVASPAPSDSNSGTIVVSNSGGFTNAKLVDTVSSSIAPGVSDTFVFKLTSN